MNVTTNEKREKIVWKISLKQYYAMNKQIISFYSRIYSTFAQFGGWPKKMEFKKWVHFTSESDMTRRLRRGGITEKTKTRCFDIHMYNGNGIAGDAIIKPFHVEWYARDILLLLICVHKIHFSKLQMRRRRLGFGRPEVESRPHFVYQ